MPAIDKPDSQLTTTVKWRFPSVHPEGRKSSSSPASSTLVTYSLLSHFVGWLLVGLTIWVAAFFRDPIRTTPPRRTDRCAGRRPGHDDHQGAAAAGAAGDGGLGRGEFTRVSIFMSVFDVHINRSPIAGRVRTIAYVPGKFLNADLDKASEDNERQHFLVERDGRRCDRLHPDRRPGRAADPVAFVKEGDMSTPASGSA